MTTETPGAVKAPLEAPVRQHATWNREWPDVNCALVQWPFGYAEIHGSRFGRESVALFLEQASELYADAQRWRWLRQQKGWPESEAAMMAAKPEDYDALADAGIRAA